MLDNQQKVYNLALKTLGNPDDALDIAQEAFLRAYRYLDAFRGESRFSVWLYRLTYNLCIDFIRKAARVNKTSLTYAREDGETGEMEIPDLRNLPEDFTQRRETREAIAEGLAALNPKQREIILLREITGMSYAELSATLNVNEGTVKSRLSRARISLAGILARKGTFPDSVRLNEQKEVGERE